MMMLLSKVFLSLHLFAADVALDVFSMMSSDDAGEMQNSVEPTTKGEKRREKSQESASTHDSSEVTESFGNISTIAHKNKNFVIKEDREETENILDVLNSKQTKNNEHDITFDQEKEVELPRITKLDQIARKVDDSIIVEDESHELNETAKFKNNPSEEAEIEANLKRLKENNPFNTKGNLTDRVNKKKTEEQSANVLDEFMIDPKKEEKRIQDEKRYEDEKESMDPELRAEFEKVIDESDESHETAKFKNSLSDSAEMIRREVVNPINSKENQEQVRFRRHFEKVS